NVPREIVFDNKTKTNVLQWPVEEVESLRTNKTEFNDVKLGAGSIVPLKVGNQASQLDITVDFEIDKNELEADKAGGRKGYNCTTSNGAAGRSVFGPFGLLVDHSIVEAFAQGGRRVITSRIYPTEAIEGAERVFLFNNATETSVTATSIKIWQMKSASMKFYFDDQKKAD
ncbi:Acid beta-fructofuranosidase, partial [Thalictrum thalictroides]